MGGGPGPLGPPPGYAYAWKARKTPCSVLSTIQKARDFQNLDSKQKKTVLPVKYQLQTKINGVESVIKYRLPCEKGPQKN